MSNSKLALLTLSVAATAAITANRFMGFGGAPAAAAAGAYGVSQTDGAVGDLIPVDAQGTTLVTASAAIAAGALIEVAAGGKAVTKNAGIAVARAAPGASAAADGDLIEVILIPN